jgi:Ca2+-binding EF-hand superfamily protein
MYGMYVQWRGDLKDQLKWIFSLYDMNGDGFISRKEMLEITKVSVQID